MKEALSEAGVSGITLTEVKGFERQNSHTELYRGVEYVIDFLPKIKLEIAVPSDDVDKVIEAINKSANTGKSAMEKFLCQILNKLFAIRTGETGSKAL